MQKYIPVKEIKDYLKDKSYTSIHKTGSVKGMKRDFGWDKAQEIVCSGQFIYAIMYSNEYVSTGYYI